MTPRELGLELAQLLLCKAGEDEALVDEVITSPRITDSIIAFHCQQAAEKLLKAVLAAYGVIYRRTHDIGELMEIAEASGVTIPGELRSAEMLTPFAVDFRYAAWRDSSDEFSRGGARELVRGLRSWAETQILAANNECEGNED